MTKRLFDILVSFAGLVVLAPVFLVIAVAVKLDSPGPVFFRQVRVGRHGRPFRIYKFRTMRSDPVGAGPEITVGQDARITRVGGFLRRWKLDELAQLIDVLRGTMSLVGPRPEVPRYVEHYSQERRGHVLSVRPGITDFASLRFRNESEVLARAENPEREYVEVILPEKLQFAANYVDHSSLSTDLRALGLTLRTVLLPDSAKRRVRRIVSNLAFWRWVEARLTDASRWQKWLAVLADAVIVLGCWHITYLFRLGFERWQPGRPPYDDAVSVGVVLAYLVCLQLFGVRHSVWRYFGFDDFRRLMLSCLVAGLVSAAAVLMAQLSGVARAVLVLHPLFCLLALALARMALRVVWEHANAVASGDDDATRHYVIVLGAGPVARRLLAGLHQRHGWHVLGLLDDDLALQGIRVAGVRVLGGLDRIRDPSLTATATHAIVAIPEEAQAQRALELARQSGLAVLVVPSSDQLMSVEPQRSAG
jgi:lipopolysaccharide/colanic/teichoic acid biosynthesis glycosyltransferase